MAAPILAPEDHDLAYPVAYLYQHLPIVELAGGLAHYRLAEALIDLADPTQRDDARALIRTLFAHEAERQHDLYEARYRDVTAWFADYQKKMEKLG